MFFRVCCVVVFFSFQNKYMQPPKSLKVLPVVPLLFHCKSVLCLQRSGLFSALSLISAFSVLMWWSKLSAGVQGETVTLICACHVVIPVVILFLNTDKPLNMAWHHWRHSRNLNYSDDLSLPENSFRIKIVFFFSKCIVLARWTSLPH